MIAFAIIYIVVVFGTFGYLSYRRSKKVDKGFRAAGWAFPLWAVVFAVALSPNGTGYVVGLWQGAYVQGISTLWFSMAHSIALFPLVFLLWGPISRRLRVATQTQLIEYMFDRTSRGLYGVGMFGSIFTIGALETFGTSVILYLITGIPPGPLLVAISAIFVIAYTILAGMWQMAYLNLVNGIVMLVGAWLGVAFLSMGLAAHGVGWSEIVNTLAATKPEFLSLFPNLDVIIGRNLSPLANPVIPTLILVAIASWWGAQVHPAIFAKDEKTLKKAIFGTVAVNFTSSVPYALIGLAALVLVMKGIITIPEGAPAPLLSSVIMLTSPQLALIPRVILALWGISMLVQILSTAGWLVGTPAMVYTNDVWSTFVNPKASERELENVTRILIVILGIIAGFEIMAFYGGIAAIPTILWAFSLAVPGFVFAHMAYLWKGSATAFKITVPITWIVTVISSFAPQYLIRIGLPQWFAVNPVYPALLVSIVLGIILTALTEGKPAFRHELKKLEPEVAGGGE